MPLQATAGAATYDAYGSGAAAAVAANYIEDVFQTWLYTGNNSTNTITNGVDLSGKGGLVWLKNRGGANPHTLWDTARGVRNYLVSNTTAAQVTSGATEGLYQWNNNGFTLGTNYIGENSNGFAYASWTFRKQPKFFDVVTYTGDGVDDRQISHSLGSKPGCVIIKRTDTTGDWAVSHRYDFGNVLFLNTTAAAIANPSSNSYFGYPVDPLQSTYFTVGTNAATNASGGTYVAYLFAHDAGGFGASGTDNVISCGSATTNGSGSATVSLGYEPQWLLVKSATSAQNWYLFDNMRGIGVEAGYDYVLYPNLANAEAALGTAAIDSTGFSLQASASQTYIYIAIRRGPMRTPTTGTSVFGLNARSGTGANATVTGGQISDAALIKNRGSAVGDLLAARLTAVTYLETSSTAAQVYAGTTILQANPWDVMDGVKVGTTSTITNASSNTFINYLFRRAPGFFDVVCYTGTGANRTVNHNLGVVPELMIVKCRSAASTRWVVYSTSQGATKYLILNETTAVQTDSVFWNDTTPTASVFTVGVSGWVNGSGSTYVAYLFATVAGVSKVGSYTGNGSSQTINCGFTGGSRFVLIKRTDSTGDWTVFDSARGIVAGNDPALYLNSTAAEVTTADAVDTDSTGFVVNQESTLNLNVNTATYIFLAVS